MKGILKRWWVWLIVIIIIAIAIFAFLKIKNKNEGIGTAGINKKEFNKIEIGMSQFEVEKIIDELDEWNNDEIYEKCCQEISSTAKNHVYEYKYKYLGENGGYVIITYEADYSKESLFVLPTVSKKEQYNLK